MPRRGPRHYTEIWADEDGSVSSDHNRGGHEGLPPNQARGNLENMTDDVAETDQVSNGPLLNRLLSLLITENRPPPAEDGPKINGTLTNGVNGESSDITMNGIDNSIDPLELPTTNGAATNGKADTSEKPLPPATAVTDFALPFRNGSSSSQQSLTPKLDHNQLDERLKAEFRHLGFLPPDAEPDFDAHEDDEVAERLRLLQRELKEVSIVNGARKARLAELVEERVAYQEYSTILEDLDSQVQQAYQKRNRNIKNKKQVKRPGGAGGGSHVVNAGEGGDSTSTTGLGISRPAIGDNVKALLERRKRWSEKIGPVFSDDVNRVRTEGEDVFDEESMKVLMQREREMWDEEVGE